MAETSSPKREEAHAPTQWETIAAEYQEELRAPRSPTQETRLTDPDRTARGMIEASEPGEAPTHPETHDTPM